MKCFDRDAWKVSNPIMCLVCNAAPTRSAAFSIPLCWQDCFEGILPLKDAMFYTPMFDSETWGCLTVKHGGVKQ